MISSTDLSTIDEVSNEVLSLQSEQLVINLDKVEEERVKGENGEMIATLTADGSFCVIETSTSDDFATPPETIEPTINGAVACEITSLVKHEPLGYVPLITEIASISKQEITTTNSDGGNGNEEGTHVECDLDRNPQIQSESDHSPKTDDDCQERPLSDYQTFTNYSNYAETPTNSKMEQVAASVTSEAITNAVLGQFFIE